MAEKDTASVFDKFGTKNKPKQEVKGAKQTTLSEEDIAWAEELAAKYDPMAKKKKKKTMEESHKRVTFLMRRDLNDRLDALSAANGRGFKTEFLNEAIEKQLAVFEALEQRD